MQHPKLDISSLEKATNSLQEALEAYQKHPKNTFIRDSVIQRFEYTYEISGKMLKRYLEMTEASTDDIEKSSFPNLIRTGAERGLFLYGWEGWQKYRAARNITSHTYDEKKALEVCSIVPEFFIEIQYFLTELQKRIADL